MNKKNKTEEIESKNIQENIDKLIGKKFGDYSKYIIQERALPDLRDGLKPVQRRILYAMSKLNLSHTSAYKKSARVVGDVIGKYHPHGDASVYEAMVRMAQNWKTNIPLVDMHGNKGSIDGDSPAAMRYTESRLAKISNYLLTNIEKGIVPFTLNFDDTEKEPVVLPALFPNLLLNGSTGIASGYSTNIPPHNFNEIIEGLIYVLKNVDNVKYSKLKKIISAPDFPTGGTINGRKGVDDAYREGKGKIILRAKYYFSENNREIIIKEIPFETSKSDIIKKITKITLDRKVPGLYDVRDDSDRNGMQITILLKKNSDPNLVINYLLLHTDLEKPYYANFIAIQDKKPVLLNLRDILDNFANFQIEIYKNLYEFELIKYQKKLEILEALIKVVSVLDETIRLIRNSKNKQVAKEKLIKFFKFNNNQAEAIVNLRLYRLTSTNIKELMKDFKNTKKQIKFLSSALRSKKVLRKEIIKQLEILDKEFKIPRKTEILNKNITEEISEEDLIEKKDIYFGITYEGYIKVVDANTRAEIDFKNYNLNKNDFHIFTKKISNMKKVFFFTTTGKYFVVPAYKLNENKWGDIGDHISKYVSVDVRDHIITCAFIDDVKELKKDLIVSTKLGRIKRIKLRNFENQTTRRGQKYISISKEDWVISVDAVNSKEFTVSSVTSDGYYVKYPLHDIPASGLNTTGINNLKLNKNNNFVVSTIVVKNDQIEDTNVLFLTKYARAKKVRFNDLEDSPRGSNGIKILNKYSDDYIIQYLNIDKYSYVDVIWKSKRDKTPERIEASKAVSISSIRTNFNWMKNNEEIVRSFKGKELEISHFVEQQNDLNFENSSSLNLEDDDSNMKQLDVEEMLKKLD